MIVCPALWWARVRSSRASARMLAGPFPEVKDMSAITADEDRQKHRAEPQPQLYPSNFPQTEQAFFETMLTAALSEPSQLTQSYTKP